ncbi:membrane protein insertase YidC [Candidatus Cytomitobacter primus]|uniref:Membrane protein insertase YidC n=1 Tax=Candidatus Cytomitobacter primus TaxID=2066024 RepID=A0A5C0UFN4_9PROT|nr:membrane protein insertase YidC [Candidatus Cytomitobacter primus]QEK38530.1 membrane protein insertase YidC [Candidatus Cytomitobacter primus]
MKKYLFYINIFLFFGLIWSFYNKYNASTKNKVNCAQIETQSKLPDHYIGNGLAISDSRINGKIDLQHNRFIDLSVKYYDKNYDLLKNKSFLKFIWKSNDICIPKDIEWEYNSNTLSKDKPLILSWKNKDGSIFIQSMQIIDDYMIKVEYSVFNALDKVVNIGLWLSADIANNTPLYHQNGKIIRSKSGDMRNIDSWFGFESTYAGLFIIPDHNSINNSYHFSNKTMKINTVNKQINPKESVSWSFYIFVGPKKLSLLKQYSNKYGISNFDNAIDYGFMSFITKPLFIVLSYIMNICGSFIISLFLLTLVMKIILLPFSYKSHISMVKMQKLQPQLDRIKEMYKGDNVAIQQAILTLYKKESINPLGGCLPLLFQIPLFIPLYTIVSISIDTTTSGFLWIKDLSASDPYSLNALMQCFTSKTLPFNISILSILFVLTMLLQQWNTFKNQKDNFILIFPLILAIMLSGYSSAFILYMIWSNILSYLQTILFDKLIK